MKKEFTVGNLIEVLQNFDPDLPLYDCYDDENEGKCWFNLQKPKPKIKKLYLIQYQGEDDTLLLKLTDKKKDAKDVNGKVLGQKNMLVLYPLNKNEIEIG